LANSTEQWGQFRFIEGDIRNLKPVGLSVKVWSSSCTKLLLAACRSLEDPLQLTQQTLTASLNMLVAARDEGVNRFIYAASSSTYGDRGFAR
jgi:UDP-N-acetylglucosamine 4-epimerase